MNTNELIDYYANLLIMQYKSKPRAYATIQALAAGINMPQTTVETVSLSGVPASGTFVLSYGGVNTAAINWNDNSATVQIKLRAIDGLEDVTVLGSPAERFITVTFEGVTPPAQILEVVSTSMQTSAPAPVSIQIAEIDEILPIAVQNAYNLMGENTAVGAQLDAIAKYAGVSRTGPGFYEQVVLSDADFLSLIKLAIVKNTSSSSLGDIQELLNTFFPDEILIFDSQLMKISYFISSSLGSRELVEMFIMQKILPKPMGVKIAVILYVPDVNSFFGFRTYTAANPNVKPFNSYTDYDPDTEFLSYQDAIVLPP
jgi:hypothetical protein